MTIHQLIQSAETLPAPGADSISEYDQKQEQMVAMLNNIMKDRKDLKQLIGEGNLDMMLDNHRNHARFIASFLITFEPQLLVNTILWVFRAYRSHGFRLTYWPAQLHQWMVVLKQCLSPQAFNQIAPLYNWMIINQPAFASLSDEGLESPEGIKHQ